MQPNTLTRPEYKGKVYVKIIRRNSCRIRIRNQLKSNPRYRTDPKKSFRIHNTGNKYIHNTHTEEKIAVSQNCKSKKKYITKKHRNVGAGGGKGAELAAS
jgi:hypothetical protein